MKKIILVNLFVLAFACVTFAGDTQKAGSKDKCPVCGMFVAKYPYFAAQIHFRDGSISHFDGSKDLFKYYLNLSRYAPCKKTTDITALFVTDPSDPCGWYMS